MYHRENIARRERHRERQRDRDRYEWAQGSSYTRKGGRVLHTSTYCSPVHVKCIGKKYYNSPKINPPNDSCTIWDTRMDFHFGWLQQLHVMQGWLRSSPWQLLNAFTVDSDNEHVNTSISRQRLTWFSRWKFANDEDKKSPNRQIDFCPALKTLRTWQETQYRQCNGFGSRPLFIPLP